MFVISFKMDTKNFAQTLRKEILIRSEETLKEGLNKWRYILQEKMVKNVSGIVLHSRTGALKESVRVSAPTKISDSVYQLIAWLGTVYGPVHETGATITSSNWMTIPLPPIRPQTGRARPLRSYQSEGVFFRKAKTASDTLVAYLPKGRGRSKKAIPIYVLKKKVRIPERPWFSKSLEEAIELLPEALS